MKFSFKACLWTGLFFFSAAAHSQTLKPEQSAFMQSWFKRHRVNPEHLSFALADVATGAILEEHRSTQVHPLASVSKMFTSRYVLDVLGEDIRFQTRVLSEGSVSGGTLKGKLVLQGNGDPMLFIPDLAYLCEQIAAKGIQKVEGEFLYDDQFPYSKEEISSLGLGDQTYNSGISGLNINFNRIEFLMQRNSWHAIPPLSSMQVISSDREFAPGVRFSYVPVNQDAEQWEYTPKKRYSAREEIPMKRPGLHAATLMQGQCRQYGVILPNPKRWESVPYKAFKGRELALHQSINIKEIQRLALEYSNNIMAESSLLLAAATQKNAGVTLREASSAMVDHLKKSHPKLPWDQVLLVNGSGISSENKSSAGLLAQWLAQIEHTPTSSGRRLKTLLPLVGHSGWISARFKYPDVTHRMWAKTGSLDYVTNLAGYLIGKDHKIYSFALLFAQHDKRQYLDTFNDDKSESMRRGAPGARRAVSNDLDEILSHWLDKY